MAKSDIAMGERAIDLVEATQLEGDAAALANAAKGEALADSEELQRARAEELATNQERLGKINQKRIALMRQVTDDIDAGNVPVEKIWSSKTNLLTIIGVALYGMAGGDVPALMGVINKQIETEIAQQQREADRGMKAGTLRTQGYNNIVAMFREAYGDDEQAAQAAYLAKMAVVKSQLDQQLLKTQDPVLKARLLKVKAGIMGEVERRQAQLAAAQSAKVTSEAGDRYRPGGSRAVGPAPAATGASDKELKEYWARAQQLKVPERLSAMEVMMEAIPEGEIRDRYMTAIGSGMYGQAAAIVGQAMRDDDDFGQNVARYLNRKVKFLTGAQMGETEIGRYAAELGQMEPTRIQAALGNDAKELERDIDSVGSSFGGRAPVVHDTFWNTRHNMGVRRRMQGGSIYKGRGGAREVPE
jgi:hypothetical protein